MARTATKPSARQVRASASTSRSSSAKATTTKAATPKTFTNTVSQKVKYNPTPKTSKSLSRTAKRGAIRNTKKKTSAVAPRKVFTLNKRSATQNAAQQTATYKANLAKNQLPFLNSVAQRTNAAITMNKAQMDGSREKLKEYGIDPDNNDPAMNQEMMDKLSQDVNSDDPIIRGAAQDAQKALQDMSDLNFTIGQQQKSLDAGNQLAGGFRNDLLNKPADQVDVQNPLLTNGGQHNSNPLAPSTGAIQDSERARLAGNNNSGVQMTPEQIAAQEKSMQPQIQETMTNTGQTPPYFDGKSAIPQNPNQILNSNPLVEGKNKKIAAAQAEYDAKFQAANAAYADATKGGNGANLGISDFFDQEGEEAALADKIAQIESENEIGEHERGTDTGVQTDEPSMDLPTPESFLTGLDQLEQQYAGTTMAPIFDFYKGQYQNLQSKGLAGAALLDAVQKRTDQYIADRKTEMAGMEERWAGMYKDNKASQIASARRTYEAQRELADIQREREAEEYDRAIRDQMIQNEEDRQSLLLSNGISGGWRSAMHTSRVIDAMKKGERIVSDMRGDKMFAGKMWDQKVSEIIGDYHGNVTTAYDTYNVNMSSLQDKLAQQAAEIDKTVFSNDVKQMEAIGKMTDQWYDGISNISNNLTNQLIGYQTQVEQRKQAQTNFMMTQQGTIWDDAIKIAGMEGEGKDVLWGSLKTRAEAFGVTLPNTPPDIATASQASKTRASDAMSSLVGNPNYVKDDLDYGYLLSRSLSASKFSDDDIMAAVSREQQNLATGNFDTVGDSILNNVRQGFPVSEHNSVVSQNNIIRELDIAKGFLDERNPSFGGKWKNFIESGKSFGELKKDEEFEALKAHIENVIGLERHERFGATLTEGESYNANNFLPDFKNDTAATILNKIETFSGVAKRSRAQKYDNVLGSGVYEKITGEKIPTGVEAYEDDTPAPSYETLYNRWNIPQANGGRQEDVSIAGIDDYQNHFSSVTQKFDTPVDYTKSGKHGGIDYDGKIGDNIPAFKGGKVVDVVDSGSSDYGLYVDVMDDDGYVHRYGHLSSANVKKGDAIRPGQSIALMGNSGYVIKNKGGDGSHLHYEVRKDGKLYDPEKLYGTQNIAHEEDDEHSHS